MNEIPNWGLLPAGLSDVLPPDAAHEAEVLAGLMDLFASHGFERVKPPLIEFEESLLGGAGAATASETFRLMDPDSQHMMGVRSDITVQVARIATTRLARAPRPLRLSYAGQVLRVRGTQLRPERQLGQAGIEIIGSDSSAGDVEVVLLAAEALDKAGVAEVSVDLNMPSLVPALCADCGLGKTAAAGLRQALDRKDSQSVSELGGKAAGVLGELLEAAGDALKAMAALEKIDLPATAAGERTRLLGIVSAIQEVSPAITLTIDPVENRGFEYHNGVTFSLFSRKVRGELGRGGRYLTGSGGKGQGGGESATGFTLFVDALMGALPKPKIATRLYVPFGTLRDDAARLRGEGWVVVGGLEAVDDPLAEARRMGCSHALVDGKPVAAG